MTRRKPWHRIATWALGTVAFVGVVLTMGSLYLAIGDHQFASLARELRERGVATTGVVVSVSPASKSFRGEVRVELASGLTVIERGADPERAAVGSSEQQVLVLPDVPSQAMNANDIDYYADDAVNDDLAVAGLGVTLLALSAAGFLGWPLAAARRARSHRLR